VHDQFAHRRRFRILNVVDDVTRGHHRRKPHEVVVEMSVIGS
jgi:hypothetical protein